MRTRLTVALVSASVMTFQIVLTRLFSLVFSYHYTFLGVSVALCGLGLGGALVTRSGLRQEGCEARHATLFGLGICFTLAVILLLPNVPTALIPALPAALAFVAAGAFLASALRSAGQGVGGLYGASLAGSAAGCVVVFPLLAALGATGTVAVSALAAGGAAAIEAAGSRRSDPWARILLIVLLGWAVAAPWLLPAAQVGGRSDKEFAEARRNYTPHIEASRWSGFARTDLVSVAEIEDEKILYTDGAAPAPLLRWSGVDEEMPRFDDFVGAAAFRLRPIDDALVLGSGGGRDVLLALSHGAQRVTAVEINPDMVELVNDAADYAGDIYRRRGVELEVREARSFLRATERRWDLIYISLPRSQRSANLAGYQLVENYLMSVEALEDYYAHLTDEGLLAIVAYGEADMLKLFGMTQRRWVRRGLDDAGAMRHVAVLRQPNELGVMRYLFLARARPFDEADLRAASQLHGRQGLELQLWTREPGRRAVQTGSLIESLCVQVTDVGIDTWISELGRIQNVDLAPPTDERPFFYKWTPGVPGELLAMLIGSLIAAAGVALAAGRSLRDGGKGIGRRAAWLGYFALLGGGFALVEIALVHKASFFLGAPAHSLAVTLGALLLGGGAGSVASTRVGRRPWAAPAAVVVLALLSWWGLSSLLQGALGWGFAGRATLVAALAALAGFAMGMPFPLGLARLAGSGPERIPWAWAINGMVSVTGSVAAVVIAMIWGFSDGLLVGAGAYLGATGLLALRDW